MKEGTGVLGLGLLSAIRWIETRKTQEIEDTI